MTVDFKTIGKRIKAHRRQRKMTQAVLAERVGVSSVYISYIETGVKGVSLEVLLKMADEFDLSMDSLVLTEPSIRLPKACQKLTKILADCDIDEIDQIARMVSDYKKMIRIK